MVWAHLEIFRTGKDDPAQGSKSRQEDRQPTFKPEIGEEVKKRTTVGGDRVSYPDGQSRLRD